MDDMIVQTTPYFSFGRKNVWKVVGVLHFYFLYELHDTKIEF